MLVQFMKVNLSTVSHSSSVSTKSTSMRVPWKVGRWVKGGPKPQLHAIQEVFHPLLYRSCVKYGLGTSVNAPIVSIMQVSGP